MTPSRPAAREETVPRAAALRSRNASGAGSKGKRVPEQLRNSAARSSEPAAIPSCVWSRRPDRSPRSENTVLNVASPKFLRVKLV
jgi:hypothetical protein